VMITFVACALTSYMLVAPQHRAASWRSQLSALPASAPFRATPARLALDMKDPAVAEEYASCMALDADAMEEELALSGIIAPPTMSDFDMRSMIVELRLRNAGKIGSQTANEPKKPAEGASAFEVALYEKPAFKALYESFKSAQLANEVNLCIEYLNDARRAAERYGGTAKFDETVAKIDAALSARVEQKVTTGAVCFSGFPSNMGEAGVRMTLESFGSVLAFSCDEAQDGMTLTGRVEFEEVASAKACIDKWDGIDMGLGTTLELRAA